MRTHSVVRRMSVLTLAVILSFVGMARPTSAAGEEDVVVERHRGLTFNGRPLSELAVLRAPQARPSVPPPNRRRVSADQLLGGAPVTDSLDALISILPGYEVVVWDDAGRKTRGRVLSISGDEVVVTRRRRWFGRVRSLEELMFDADRITRMDIVDSTWNGTLIGAAIAPALVFGIYKWEDSAVPDSSNLKGLGTMLFGGLSAVLSVGVGQAIDLSINESIYAPSSPRVTVAPLIGRDRRGLMAVVSF